MQKAAVLFIVIITLLVSCRKETLRSDCEGLRNGLSADDAASVQTIITDFIAGLPNDSYDANNINALASRISSECNVSAEVICFDCIQTLPSQSEIRISFDSAGGQIQKCIDLSYNAQNKIIFRAMHP
jgi:hypothetical protein